MSAQSHDYLYGINTVRDLVKHNVKSINAVYVNAASKNKRVDTLRADAEAAGLNVELCDGEKFAELLQTAGLDDQANHQSVLASYKPQPAKDEKYLESLLKRTSHSPLLLILDAITDPHNLGACLRAANAAGADAVVVPKDKSVGLNATVRKVASGAAETTPVIEVKNLARCLQNLQKAGVWIMGAAGEADQSLYALDLAMPVAIVMGSEGSGMRRLTRERCDALFSIPMKGTVESLNVSVAAGVCLFEALRQRQS
jgi:23S rRNA (guanosine2251-2'-O)-methyltransferase